MSQSLSYMPEVKPDDEGMQARQSIWIINQYATTPQTGVGGRHYYIARELVDAGYDVYVLAASYTHLMHNPPSVHKIYTLEQVEGINYVWIRVPTYSQAHSKGRILSWFTFAWRVRGVFRFLSRKPVFILCSSPSLVAFLGARYLRKRLKAKLAFEVRDIWPLTLVELGGYSVGHPFIRFLQWVEDKAYCESDAVISNLPNASGHMESRGMDPKKFTWIPNGFSLKEIGESKALPQNVSAQLPVGKFVVGYTGTIGSANALDSLLDAAKLLSPQVDVVFVLVGAGKEKSRLVQRARDEGLSNVLFLEPIPKVQIQSMLAHFDVCYIGLTADPLFRFGVSPNKLFDYFCAAKPVLYSIESGGSLVDKANAGISVMPENPTAIVEAIQRFYEMPRDKRITLGDNGRRYVLANHEYGMLAKKLIDVIKGVGAEKE